MAADVDAGGPPATDAGRGARASPPRSSTPASTRSPGPSPPPRPSDPLPAPSRASRSDDGLGVTGVVGRARASPSAGPSWLAEEWASALAGRAGWPRPPTLRRRRRAPWSPSAGTARPRGLVVVADTVKPTSAEAVAGPARARPRAGAAHRRPRAAPRAPSPTQVGIERRDRRGAARATRCDVVAGAAGARDGWWPWSATASTTRPRWRRPTSASRWAPAPTSRSRRATSPWSAATCAPRPTRSGCRAARCAPSRATCSGRSPTTWPRSRSPSRGCSTR